MTKKLEETFNISAEDEEDTNTPTIEESQEITELLNTEIENTEKIDAALPVVTDLNEHDREMDDIHAKALKTFEDLLQLGMNVEVHAGAKICLLYTSPSPRDRYISRMPSSA